MPYSRKTTDRYNMCNISSSEIPDLDKPLAVWLSSLDDSLLAAYGIGKSDINDSETYSRVALGDYFRSQYRAISNQLLRAGISVIDYMECEVLDLIDVPYDGIVSVKTAAGEIVQVEHVVIATGHNFQDNDHPNAGCFASPWPIQKLLPKEGQFFNFTIGTLGSSLSAYDVVASLAFRHGMFEDEGSKERFIANENAKDFKIVMHSANGWLPHLQYEQEEAFREIYRHATREQMLALRDERGRLTLSKFFDSVCRPALCKAFAKDERRDIVAQLCDPNFGLSHFVDQMSEEHSDSEPFDRMRQEMPEAMNSMHSGKPIHWKEVLDDLMFMLNFHFEWLYAEEVLQYKQIVVPFLMNVIAAMPLKSARKLLALADAGHLELMPGYVEIAEVKPGSTVITVENEGATTEHEYRLFVDCSGQGTIDYEQFPFLSLRESGVVSQATVPFNDPNVIQESAVKASEIIHVETSKAILRVGGIAIDGFYRVIGTDEKPNPRIFDIAFPHTTGFRPYSYGLQACSTSAAIVVDALCERYSKNKIVKSNQESTTQAYDTIAKPD